MAKDSLRFVKSEKLLLRDSEFSERWLQDQIIADPSILGLRGSPYLIESERRQEKAGRLDLLLSSENQETRYEVELQLGKTDESHIIRCIEYWDIERRRYPAYEHVAVLVAEDVTTRFLQLLGLFAGTIPLVVIQLNALKVEDQIVLDFVRVLDQRTLRRDDSEEKQAPAKDRPYWNKKSSKEILSLTDKLLDIINEKASPQRQLNYLSRYIGLTDGIRVSNFVYFQLRKKHVYISCKVEDFEGWAERLESVGLSTNTRRDRTGVAIKPSEFESQKARIAGLLHAAVSFEQG